MKVEELRVCIKAAGSAATSKEEEVEASKALDLFDQAVKRPAGGDTRSKKATIDNNVINGPRVVGNSKQAGLRTLRANAPEPL